MSKHEFYELKIIDNQRVKWVPGTNYKVAADVEGNVYVLKEGRLMKKIGKPNRFGYVHFGGIMINGREKAVYAHTLVAETFLGPKPGDNYFVHHINGILHDNRVDNLAWMTVRQCSILYHTMKKEQGYDGPKPHFKAEYPIKEVDKYGNCLRTFRSIKEAARILAREEGHPEKWNSIATQLSYHLNKKYGCKSVRKKQFRFLDCDDPRPEEVEDVEVYSDAEKEIMDNMRKAFMAQIRKRKQEDLADDNKNDLADDNKNTELYRKPRTTTVHKYYPKKKIKVEFEIETDFTGRIDLTKI